MNPTPTITLPQAVYDEIVAHAREGKPEEICGLVRQHPAKRAEVLRARNMAAERIENYEVDDEHLLLFALHEEEMIGVYHSHPVSVAYPSPTDALIAGYPDKLYFICSLEFDDAPVIRAFQMIEHFVELDMAALRRNLAFYENRPGLFAYYQATNDPIPAALTDLAEQVITPFYIVHDTRAEGDQAGHIVVVIEHQVVCE
jgi:proteasome lid subunit RPN8/RPN11